MFRIMETCKEPSTATPIVIVVENSSTKVPIEKAYKSREATVIGIILIICGVSACCANIGHFFMTGLNFGLLATGIWTSFFFFISGGLSICSGRHSSSWLIINTMVMSIISSISAGTLIIISGIGLGIPECIRHSCGEVEVNIFHIVQLLAGILAIPTAITSSVLSCTAIWCRERLDTSIPLKVLYRTGEEDLDPQPVLRQAMQIIQADKNTVKQNGGDIGDTPVDYDKL